MTKIDRLALPRVDEEDVVNREGKITKYFIADFDSLQFSIFARYPSGKVEPRTYHAKPGHGNPSEVEMKASLKRDFRRMTGREPDLTTLWECEVWK